MIDKYLYLKQYFGYSQFREGQEDVVNNILNGRDALCIMPTGGGKSICYQLPGLIMDGVTLVISPLISLMKDQVNALTQAGIPAAYINSTLTYGQYLKALNNIKVGKYKIIYVAPERLLTGFADVCRNIKISLVAVDEAHCVSQWGQDFRPNYLKIAEFVKSLKNRPVVAAFTATATSQVKADIKRLLELSSPYEITTGFDRPNLYFGVIKPKNKRKEFLELIKERKDKSGIVYCATRKNVEEICEFLNDNGFSATRYHAGLEDDERKKNQDDFIYDRKTIMVATNAFGMGIDKSNVAYVIHYNMAKNIESYYQEAGRAGRDGRSADCILLYSPSDMRTNQFLIENSEPNPELTEKEQEECREREFDKLIQMNFYCTTKRCLRKFILDYFGERASNSCKNCSNCLAEFTVEDITVEAQKILSCIIRIKQRYGKEMVCDILRGSENKRITDYRLNEQSTYGIMAEHSEAKIKEIIDYLLLEGYIYQEGGEYPVLKVTQKSRDVLKGTETLKMLTEKPRKKKKAQAEIQINRGLMFELKKLRKSIAEKSSVPAYVVFSDLTLHDMCKKLPLTEEEFLEVSGVGELKNQRYGKEFMAVIKNYVENNNSEV